ncbi:MAG: TonB-dependent receptor [Thiomicrospira sp.]|jgi:iron complex outermembrane receptor protein|nr:TonB-dependent receptor [Thiomicrospira sp.]
MKKKTMLYKTTCKKTILSAAIAGVFASPLMADDTFTLGKITVGGEQTQKIEANVVNADEMRAQGLTDVGQAVSRVPGVVIREGGRRAETQAAIRGFDSRQITLNLDGIPIYLPYDGNIDLSRYLTGDLSRIEVQKSLGSLLLGPNNMGGSINLVSRKPTESLEGRATLGMEAGKNGVFSRFGNLQVGSRLNELFYISAGFSKIDKDNFPLSDSFSPATNQFTNTVIQPKGDRVRSASDSQNMNLKLGFTPNETDEYALSYHQVRGRKDAPLYAGGELTGTSARPAYWDWPQWDKDSVYFLSHTQLGEKTYVKTRAYYDQFNNKLNSYNDINYKAITAGYAFRSQYDDESLGGSVELGHHIAQHQLKAAFHAKYDEHKERDLNKDVGTVDERWKTYQNQIHSFGLEDRIQLTQNTQLTLGYRRDQYKVTKTDDRDPTTQPSSDQGADNVQVKAEHQFGAHTVFGGVSKKTRYPSIKEIYSYRLGQAIPNANLGAESALHYEIGALGDLGPLNYQLNLFYSDISDAIESITLTSGADAGKFQNKNVGTATHYGAEVMLSYPTSDNTRLDVNYAYVKRDLADKTLVPTQSPEHQGLVTMNWFTTDKLDLAAELQFASQRDTTTDGKRTTAGYELVHLRAAYQFNKTLSANAVLKNALDKDYQIYDGDPMPGRTLWVSVNAAF